VEQLIVIEFVNDEFIVTLWVISLGALHAPTRGKQGDIIAFSCCTAKSWMAQCKAALELNLLVGAIEVSLLIDSKGNMHHHSKFSTPNAEKLKMHLKEPFFRIASAAINKASS
jgi:hypothetical protein